jgi:hypothetical protein
MLSVKFCLPWVWRKKTGRSRAPSRRDPPASPSMNRISCLTNRSRLKRLAKPSAKFSPSAGGSASRWRLLEWGRPRRGARAAAFVPTGLVGPVGRGRAGTRSRLVADTREGRGSGGPRRNGLKERRFRATPPLVACGRWPAGVRVRRARVRLSCRSRVPGVRDRREARRRG